MGTFPCKQGKYQGFFILREKQKALQCNTDIDKDKDKDIDKDKEIELLFPPFSFKADYRD